jgi:hypothetical protein
MRRRARAARRGGFVASVGGVVVIVAAACSKTPAGAETIIDGGSLASGEDASLDVSVGITLDALPTEFKEAAATEDAGEDSAPAHVIDAATCAKPSASDPCGLDPQCGCSSTETCDVNGAATECVAAGNAPLAHGCVATASCAAGLTCFNGACRPYCSSSGDAGCEAKLPEGGTCVAVEGDDGGPLPNYDVCTFNCQLQDPNACGQNGSLSAGCIADGVGGTDCEDMGLSGIGASCVYINDCLPGLVCTGTCLQWCRIVASPSDCGDGEACQAFGGGAVMANGIEYGYCP